MFITEWNCEFNYCLVIFFFYFFSFYTVYYFFSGQMIKNMKFTATN